MKSAVMFVVLATSGPAALAKSLMATAKGTPPDLGPVAAEAMAHSAKEEAATPSSVTTVTKATGSTESASSHAEATGIKEPSAVVMPADGTAVLPLVERPDVTVEVFAAERAQENKLEDSDPAEQAARKLLAEARQKYPQAGASSKNSPQPSGLGVLGRVAFHGLLVDGANTFAFASKRSSSVSTLSTATSLKLNGSTSVTPPESFLHDCANHLRLLLEEIDRQYTFKQAQTVLNNECKLSKSFPVVYDSGFDNDEEWCLTFAEDLANLRMRQLALPEKTYASADRRAFCADFYTKGVIMEVLAKDVPSSARRLPAVAHTALLIAAVTLYGA